MRVLMLGWEYPPILNGGLGVACNAIANALAEFANITVIVPRAKNESTSNNVAIVGLNHLVSQSKYWDELPNINYESIQVAAALPNPYVSSQENFNIIKTNFASAEIPSHANNLFNQGNLYDQNLWARIHYYNFLVEKVASELDFDIIYAHDWMTFQAGQRLKNKFLKPLVVHVHSLEYDRIGNYSDNAVTNIEKSAMNDANSIVAVSNYTAHIIKNCYQINSEKVYAIHNGSVGKKHLDRNKKIPDKVVLFIGRLTNQKGPHVFISIAKQVLQKVSNVRFVIAGTGEQFEDLITITAHQEIGHKVHFTGFLNRKQIEELLSISDVYCMPSVSEPFGLSAMEAAEFGIPCVLSKQAGAIEILKGSRFADHWDTELFAKHIVDILSNPQLAQEISEANYKALENYSWRNTSLKLMEIFNAQIH
jgi:hypothetical protein